MKILFAGTGAADYDWSRYGEPGIMGSTATLIDDSVLIDCGPSVAAALKRFGADYSRITHIVVTHNHSDHFNLDSLKTIAQGNQIELFGPAAVCAKARPYCASVHELDYGSRFRAGDYEFLTLPSNHTVTDIFEKTFLYLITGRDRTLLYALDTAWFPTLAYRLLGKTYLNGVIWDATMSEPGNWRIFEHTDPVMFAMMRRTLTENGNLDENTRIWFDHRARTLWPADPAEQEKIAQREKVLLAHDGETVIL